MSFLLGRVQEPPPPTDFWSKLLGIDRVNLRDGEMSLAWQHMPPAWVIFLILIPAVLLVATLIYRKERKDVGVVPKVVLTTLRALLLLVILFLLMGPVLTVETIKMRNAFIIVLLDESRSMQKTDLLQTAAERDAVAKVAGVEADTELRALTRADLVRKVLENPRLKILDELEKKLNVAYFTFSSVASAKEDRKKLFEDYRKDTCIGTETAIGDAIKASLNALRGQYLAGVLVFSDGKNNAGMATGEIAKQLKQRYLPIYTVAAGVPHAPKDIQILELEALDAVLANDNADFKFKVTSFGYDKEDVNVGLWIYSVKEKDKDLGQDPKDLDRLIEESRKETDLNVTLDGSQKQNLSMQYTPKTPGEYLAILRIDPRAEENTAHNNYVTHRFTVADDKIKVLYVEDPPRYEYRFLKNALIRDPKILAHVLLVSADEGFPQEHTKSSEDKLFSQPLHEFPRELKELLNYDVIIYGDIEPGKLGAEAAKNIETFVSEFGGGIIFISGTRSNPRALANTPLANLLPIVPDENKDLYEQDKIWAKHLDYQLTPDGRTSPITKFKDFKDQDKNQEHWEDRAPPKDGLIGIRWFTKIKKLKAGASPLVELVGVEGETSRPPLFVTQHVGRGRVFWSATDETWLWRRLAGDYPWFYPFWQQAMYWTRQGKLMGARRYRVTVDKERYTRGEPVQVFAYAYDEKYQPKTDRTLDVFVDPPAGRAGLDRIKVQLLKDATREGYYEGTYRPDDIGLYRIWAGDEDEATRSSAKYTVFIPDREDDEPILDEKTLKELANESYGGQYFPISEVDKLNGAIQKSENQLREVKQDDLWDSPLVYLLFALLITAEWILRKVFRML